MVYFVTPNVKLENMVMIVLKNVIVCITVLANKIVENAFALLAGWVRNVSLLATQVHLVPYALKHVKTRVQVKICPVIM